MRSFISALFLCVLGTVLSTEMPPKIQFYSHAPGSFGKENFLICHVSGFHPPEISIEVLRNGVEIPSAVQTDLAFEERWQFHLTKSVQFNPQKDEDYSCRVTHLGKPKTISWDPEM